jgi:hypothetical protein
MRGDSLEFPYCCFLRLVVLDMVEDLVVCDDLFRLVVVNGAKEFDPGGTVCLLSPHHDLRLRVRYVLKVVVRPPLGGPSGMSCRQGRWDEKWAWCWACVDTLCYHWNQTRDETL